MVNENHEIMMKSFSVLYMWKTEKEKREKKKKRVGK